MIRFRRFARAGCVLVGLLSASVAASHVCGEGHPFEELLTVEPAIAETVDAVQTATGSATAFAETEVIPVAASTADPLQTLVEDAIDVTTRRTLTTLHWPWQIMHGVLALRHDYYLKDESGAMVKAIDWIAQGPIFEGEPWFITTPYGGKAHPFTRPYRFEGHPNQFLALFTLARLDRDFSFKAGKDRDRTFTVADWIHNAKMECGVNPKEEITWTLWSLAFYIEPDAEWHNANGEAWSMERLIRHQMRIPVIQSACGGNHGLFAIACARNAYLQAGNPLRGAWLEGHMYIQQYVQLARSWQNSDGSFSSQWYKSREHTNNINRRLSTTGHCLEFLMVALPQDELEQPWIRNAVTRIARDLIDSRKSPVDGEAVGGMYHALNAIMIYRERMGWSKPPAGIAQEEKNTRVQ